MNTLQKLEQEYTHKLTGGKTVTAFAPGDTVRVQQKGKDAATLAETI